MRRKKKIAFLVSGRGSNMQAILDDKRIEAEAVCVISDTAGVLALERARARGIPAMHLDPAGYANRKAYDTALVAILRDHGVQLVILAGFDRIVSHVLLDAFPDAVMNIHPAFLPSFPGRHAQRQALEYGVRYSGCTVHFVDTGVDTGPIILQAVVPVLPDDTEETLSERILAEEHRIYPEAVRLFCERRLKVKQGQDGKRHVVQITDMKRYSPR